MTNVEAVVLLEKLSACADAVHWVRDCETSASKLWKTCQRADWMLWLAATLEVDRKLIVLAACSCARTSLKYVLTGESRPLRAIEAAEGWVCGEVSLASVRKAAAAAYAAYAAAYAAADAAAAYAAYAAAYAAYAAAADAAAADAAAYAAYAASAAAYAAAAADAANQVIMARLVRKRIPYSCITQAL